MSARRHRSIDGRVPRSTAGAATRRSRRRALAAIGFAVLATACATAQPAGTPNPYALRFDTIPVPVGRPAGDVDTAGVESRLVQDPNVKWVGTFDNATWDAGWGFNYGSADRAAAVEVPGVSQHGRVLDVVFNRDNLADRSAGAAKNGINRMAAFPLMGIAPLEEAWFRYYVYLPADWQAAGDGKMPGLAGNVDVLNAPGDTSGGGEFFPGSWSGRVMWNNATLDQVPSLPTPRTYLYVVSVGTGSIMEHRSPKNDRIYGFGEPWTDAAGDRIHMRLGEWNMIEVHYKMNTPGVEDGVFEGYLYNSTYPDGIRGAYYDTVQYRDAAHPNLAINQLQQAHYYGGAVGPRTSQHMYFDDFAISTAPIGPRRGS